MPILDSGEDDGRGYLVMAPRLAAAASPSGSPRARWLRRASLAILAGVAAALDAAHAAGVLHRDVTPGNILLDPAGPWLADFGIARRIDATILTGEGQLIGTAGYMAPEVIGGRPGHRRRPTATRLAAVAFEALTGRRLVRGRGPRRACSTRTPTARRRRASRVLAALPRAVDDVMGARPGEGARRPPAERPPRWSDGSARALGAATRARRPGS